MVDVEQIGDNSWRLCGELTFDTVTDLVDAMPEHELGAQLKFELSGLTKVDSAGVALMIEWTRTAKLNKCQVQWCNPPKALARLIQVMGVGALLSVDQKSSY